LVFANFVGISLDNHQYRFYSSRVSFASLLVVLIFSKSIKSVFSYKFSSYVFLFFLGFLDFFDYLLLYFGYQRSNGLEVRVVQYTWRIFNVLLTVILVK
ncbi:permease, partial [Campylobacter hyointestinalis subsp. hyointestinalis]